MHLLKLFLGKTEHDNFTAESAEVKILQLFV